MLRSLLAGAARRAGGACLSTSASAARARGLSSAPAPVRLDSSLESILGRFRESKRGATKGTAKALVDDFGQLQRIRVRKVLLVCSDYDSYTFEEDGLLNEMVTQWYVPMYRAPHAWIVTQHRQRPHAPRGLHTPIAGTTSTTSRALPRSSESPTRTPPSASSSPAAITTW